MKVDQMLWAIHCFDAPDAAPRRAAMRPDHSARLTSTSEVRPVLYGALVANDGITPIGSLIVVKAPERGVVEQFVATDPFTTHNVWHEIRIQAFLPSQRSPLRVHPD